MLNATASAPGKFVILGEHAVVYGKPAVALAIDRRFTTSICVGARCDLPQEGRVDIASNMHMRYISSKYRMKSLNVCSNSEIPTGGGLGSSAALSVSFSAALHDIIRDGIDSEGIANDAYEAELFAQGNGSPMDTSISTHGMGIVLNARGYGRRLWDIKRDDKVWSIDGIDVPDMTFVIGNTKIKAPTGPLVAKVRRYKDHSGFAAEIIDEIESVTLDGIGMMKSNDKVGLGEQMLRNHKLLSILGVSCKELNKLVEAALPYSYGAKLTGSGGGGSMVALTDRPEEVCKAISSRGGIPMVVKTGVEGVRLDTGASL